MISKFIILSFLALSVLSFSGCAPTSSPERQREIAVCDFFVRKTNEHWHDASLSEIYKSYPKMGKTQKEGLRNLSDGLAFCEYKIFANKDGAENRQRLQHVREKINNHYINQEKELFRKRTGGKDWCNGQSLTDIVVFSKKPERQCVYQHRDNAVFVTQVLPSGFLVGGYGVSRLVFVYKNSANDANDLVDYSGVPHGFFEYSGPYSYMSLAGQRTIHSFKRISGNPLEGFLFYAANHRR